MVNTITKMVGNFSISGTGDDGSGGEDSASSKRKRFGGCDDNDTPLRKLMYKRYKKGPSNNVVEPTILVKDLKKDSKSLSSSKPGPKSPSSEVSRPSRFRVEYPPSSKVTPPSRLRDETSPSPKVTPPSRFRVETVSPTPPKVTPPSRFRVEYPTSSKVTPPSRFRVEYPSSSKPEVINPSSLKPRSGPPPSPKVVTISKFKPGPPPPPNVKITPPSLIPTYASRFRPEPRPSLKERAAKLLEECSGENDFPSSKDNLKQAPPKKDHKGTGLDGSDDDAPTV